jgi:hypothetical protein
VRVARATGAVLALAVLALALPAAAPAQDGAYTPIVGAGSFNAAPMLEPGRYRDTVLPEEYLYYAVRVQPGQSLHVTANSELDSDAWSALNVAFVTVNVAAPDRKEIASDIDGDQNFTSADEDPADFTTEPATTVAGEDSSEVAWTGPGVYFISFYPAFVGSGEPPKAEIPFHFEVALEGDAEPEPAATPVATAKPKATATPVADDDDGGGGASPALAAGFGVGGLLVGAVAGLALVRRRG